MSKFTFQAEVTMTLYAHVEADTEEEAREKLKEYELPDTAELPMRPKDNWFYGADSEPFNIELWGTE